MEEDRFSRLSERQRNYLRQVFQHRSSQAIAFAANVSARAVDKQLGLAKDIIGATSRFEAARLFAASAIAIKLRWGRYSCEPYDRTVVS